MVFKGNLDKKDIDNLKIEDPFVKEVIEIWSETFFEERIVSKDHFLSLPLRQNSLIRINNAPILCTDWLSKGITQVKHLMDDSFNFLCLKENGSCTFCHDKKEDLIHLFWECEKRRIFWNNLSIWLQTCRILSKDNYLGMETT